MPNIPFVQYVLPRGERKYVNIDRPQNICAIADKLISSGLWFEVEILTTGQISLTITSNEQDEAHEICDNEPGKPQAAVDKLITEFDLIAYLKRLAVRSAA